jgi:hypothetical protein
MRREGESSIGSERMVSVGTVRTGSERMVSVGTVRTGSERMVSVGTVPCPVVDVEKSVVVPEQEQEHEGNNSGIGGT